LLLALAIRRPGQPSSVKYFFARAIAVIAGTALFVGAFVLSIFFFAAAFAIALVFLGFFLWKTRHLRRQMRQRFDQRDVVEGTVITDPPKGDLRRDLLANLQAKRWK
jgi:predicted PurR-regulated permease PerM